MFSIDSGKSGVGIFFSIKNPAIFADGGEIKHNKKI